MLGDNDFIKEVFEYSEEIYYCKDCGYYDFHSFKREKCPNCYSKNTTFFLIDADYIKEFEDAYIYIEDFKRISKAIEIAKNFINVGTYVLDDYFAAELKNKYNDIINVHVIIGQKGKDLIRIIKSINTFKFFIKYYPEFHLKLIVIDGILAFKGSANLTVNGWKEDAIELREMVTIPEEVRELNNKFLTYYRFAREIE